MGLYRVTVATDGSGNGTASNWNAPLCGFLLSARIIYNETNGGGTDVLLAESGGLSRTFLDIDDDETDTTYDGLSIEQTDSAGSGRGTYMAPFIPDMNLLTVTVAGGAATEDPAVTVEIALLEA